TITENAELRTGPNAAYPVIYKIEKGESFKKIDRKGKWIEVQNHAGTEKGWVAGWHTNLNIPADQSLSSNPLKGKTIVLDPGHGG
ncbi:SH3 domain-containing protein, partial [Staphylococcus hominis]